ncbi:MAG: glycosyltransferase family 39 protein [Pseudanabaena sp. ELA645]
MHQTIILIITQITQMSILIFIVSFILTLTNIYMSGNKLDEYKPCKWRISFIKTLIIYGLIISLLTEILSVSRSLNFISITIFWIILLIINLINLKFQSIKNLYSRFINKIFLNINSPTFNTILIILIICLVTAIISPPTNWDVMTYHMPRVMHWIQNQSTAHYPTNNIRQISFPAGAGYIVTQFQLLTGNDLFANLLQWLAFLGSILGISLITNILVGASAEWIGGLVCASVPMAIMQSTTTQTDLVVTFWLVCFVYFTFRTDKYTKSDIFWLSASLGLGILTKPTAIIYGFPFGIVLLIRIFRSQLKFSHKHNNSKSTILNLIQSLITTSRKILTLIIGSLLLSLPSYWRNNQTFSSFLGDDSGTRNNILGLLQLFSNVLKNLAINFVIPGFWEIVRLVHESILHVNINDVNLNLTDINKYITLTGSLRYLSPHEDFVASPIHLVLFLIIFFILLTKFLNSNTTRSNSQINKNSNILAIQTLPNTNQLLLLATAIILGFLTHSFLLKWQPWGNRLFLPLTVLTSVPIAYILTHIFSNKARKFFVLLLAITSIMYALTTMRHPLIALPVVTAEQAKEQSLSILSLERKDIYFSGVQKELKIPYQTAANLVNQSNCKHIGLAIGYDDPEYLFWILIARDRQIKNVNVQNVSRQSPPEFPDSALCAIISTVEDFSPNAAESDTTNWQSINISQSPYLKLYQKSGAL